MVSSVTLLLGHDFPFVEKVKMPVLSRNVAVWSSIYCAVFDADNRTPITYQLHGFDYNGSLSEKSLKQPRGNFGNSSVTQIWVLNSPKLSVIYFYEFCLTVNMEAQWLFPMEQREYVVGFPGTKLKYCEGTERLNHWFPGVLTSS